MGKHILVPLDGSRLAEMSLPHAVSLAHATSASITLLWVVPQAGLLPKGTPTSGTPLTLGMPLDGPFPGSHIVIRAAESEPSVAREYLNRIAERLQSEEGLNVTTVLLEGDPASVIIRYAEQNPHVKLIVMASHGRRGVIRWLFGSVTEQVLHASPVPLLLVREDHQASIEASPSHYARILVPLDGSSFDKNSLEQAKMLAAGLGATLVLTTVIPDRNDRVITEQGAVGQWLVAPWARESEWAMNYLEKVAYSIGRAGIPVEIRLSFGDPAEEILRAVKGAAADIIVMSTHGRGGVQRLWLGSVAMKVVSNTKQPVLLVRTTIAREVPELQHSAAGRTLQVCY